ncbi:MAG: hypothetical protein FWE57_02060 [Chitinispirillia bacterium]|nr:hypothetical protein [Chitinispirillia bacterium]
MSATVYNKTRIFLIVLAAASFMLFLVGCDDSSNNSTGGDPVVFCDLGNGVCNQVKLSLCTQSGGTVVNSCGGISDPLVFCDFGNGVCNQVPSSQCTPGVGTVVNSCGGSGVTTFSLNISANPAEGGTVSPAGIINYNVGATATVTATPNGGYMFVGWTGASESKNRTVTITMNSNQTLVANFEKTSSLIDPRDNKEYRTVTIGTQTWMAENLNYAGSSDDIGVCNGNNPDNCAKYGRLYTWIEFMGTGSQGSSTNHQGICPVGWHVPNDAEWTILTNFVGVNAGTKLKSREGWLDNGNGTDEFDFTALPGGVGSSYIGEGGYWWSATEDGTSHAWSRIMSSSIGVQRRNELKVYPFSVRCVKD